MRKKYLSALLFGALLLASAGTFTSCKDYDDDIKNLQEQINTVKTSLDELTTKVNNLGAGITDFKYENGQLVIVTDKGTNFTVDMPECEGIVKLEIKDGVLYADGVAVGNVSGDGGSVVEVKDGVIYIDGKAAGELGNKVAVTDNGNGTYTLTVDGKSYVLPKAVAGNVTIEIKEAVKNTDASFFTEIEATSTYTEKGFGIAWGTAAEAKDWDGPKGNVAAGQFLVGLTNTMEVEVTPNNTQLDAMKLQLVDTKGNPAPVTITAVSKNGSIEGTTGSRATDAKGQWVLSIAMDETVSADNMGSAFATSIDGSNVSTSIKNKLYALSCDGRLLTGYEIAVDTDEEATEDASSNLATYAYGKVYIGGAQLENGKLMGDGDASSSFDPLPLNTPIKLEYRSSEAYDYKFSIAKQDVNDAEKYGVKLEDNVLTASDKAATQKIHFDLKVMGVDGVVYTYKATDLANLGVAFGKTTTDAGTLAETKFKVNAASADQVIVINLGETFSSLTADEAVSLNDATWTLVDPENEDNFIVAKANLNNNISYYQDEACTQKVGFDDTADNIKKIKYAKINATNTVINKTKAEAGDYTLTLTLSSEAGQVKKVQAPVSISLPTFDELFAKSAAWDGSTAVIRLDKEGNGDFLTVYKTDMDLASNGLTVKFNKFKVNGEDKSVVSGDNASITSSGKTFKIEEAVIDNNTHALRDVVVGNVEYKVLGADKFVIKSGKFDVKFLTALDGAKLVNYVDGKEAQMTVNGPSATFRAYGKDGDGIEQGVAIVTGTKATLLGTINGVNLDGTAANWKSSFDSKAGNSAKAEVTGDADLSLSGLSQGATGEYTTEMTLTYEGIVTVGSSSVNSSVKATVKVNN